MGRGKNQISFPFKKNEYLIYCFSLLADEALWHGTVADNVAFYFLLRVHNMYENGNCKYLFRDRK